LHNGQVLNPNSYQEMTTFVGSGSYGMGISEATILGRTVWLHGGQIWGGYNSSMMYDTATGIVVCVLINQIPASAFQVAIQLLSALVSTTVGLDESNSDQLRIQVYPNPASDRVHITLPEPAIRPIQFFDSKGHEFAETTDTDCVVSDFPAGLYLIRAQTEQGTYWGKFLRQ
jgi:hypothetical protein